MPAGRDKESAPSVLVHRCTYGFQVECGVNQQYGSKTHRRCLEAWWGGWHEGAMMVTWCASNEGGPELATDITIGLARCQQLAIRRSDVYFLRKGVFVPSGRLTTRADCRSGRSHSLTWNRSNSRIIRWKKVTAVTLQPKHKRYHKSATPAKLPCVAGDKPSGYSMQPQIWSNCGLQANYRALLRLSTKVA